MSDYPEVLPPAGDKRVDRIANTLGISPDEFCDGLEAALESLRDLPKEAA